jgi:hypothetical protein
MGGSTTPKRSRFGSSSGIPTGEFSMIHEASGSGTSEIYGSPDQAAGAINTAANNHKVRIIKPLNAEGTGHIASGLHEGRTTLY